MFEPDLSDPVCEYVRLSRPTVPWKNEKTVYVDKEGAHSNILVIPCGTCTEITRLDVHLEDRTLDSVALVEKLTQAISDAGMPDGTRPCAFVRKNIFLVGFEYSQCPTVEDILVSHLLEYETFLINVLEDEKLI